jgi:hypothetical protein
MKDNKHIQSFGLFKENLNISDVRQRFIYLIGEDKIKFIEKNNLVKYDIFQNKIEIQFFMTDSKGDNVIHFSIFYNEDNEKWFSENCIDYPEILFDTYDEMKNHVKDIESEIVNNGFELPILP